MTPSWHLHGTPMTSPIYSHYTQSLFMTSQGTPMTPKGTAMTPKATQGHPHDTLKAPQGIFNVLP